jgi:hypothetical protein
MKDLVTVLFVLVLGAGVAGGFFWWKGEQAKAADLAYEQSIDRALDNSIESFRLQPLLASLGEQQGEARLAALRTAYTNAEQGDFREYDRINMGFANLQGDWPTTYASLAEPIGRETERGRFAAEVDERFGPGAHAFMRTEYERFLAELPQRMAERQAAEHRERMATARALENYRRRHW